MEKSEFQPISSLAEALAMQKESPEAMIDGYFHGIHGGGEPSSDMCRAYHHGWRTGLADGGFMENDAAQQALAQKYGEASRSQIFQVLH